MKVSNKLVWRTLKEGSGTILISLSELLCLACSTVLAITCFLQVPIHVDIGGQAVHAAFSASGLAKVDGVTYPFQGGIDTTDTRWQLEHFVFQLSTMTPLFLWSIATCLFFLSYSLQYVGTTLQAMARDGVRYGSGSSGSSSHNYRDKKNRLPLPLAHGEWTGLLAINSGDHDMEEDVETEPPISPSSLSFRQCCQRRLVPLVLWAVGKLFFVTSILVLILQTTIFTAHSKQVDTIKLNHDGHITTDPHVTGHQVHVSSSYHGDANIRVNVQYQCDDAMSPAFWSTYLFFCFGALLWLAGTVVHNVRSCTYRDRRLHID